MQVMLVGINMLAEPASGTGAIVRSRGGPTTKIHLACDSHGNPLDMEVTGGDVHESQIACQLTDVIKLTVIKRF